MFGSRAWLVTIIVRGETCLKFNQSEAMQEEEKVKFILRASGGKGVNGVGKKR